MFHPYSCTFWLLPLYFIELFGDCYHTILYFERFPMILRSPHDLKYSLTNYRDLFVDLLVVTHYFLKVFSCVTCECMRRLNIVAL